ncbi:MAG TPA: VWA domain-containing protein [Bryobacteraceae bacterium]|nr:VWA domain-containing protein [Bryobacteraceae bacterium]
MLLVVAAAALPAQNRDETVIHTETRLVVLHASVVDRHGKLITNLPQQAFKVFENGAEQSIKVFRREDVPISLGIIIDNSGSMRPRRSRVERASLDLVRASNPQDEVFVVNFNDEAYLDVPFTSDIKKMEEGIARIDSRGGTALRDSISMSMDYLKKEGKKDKKVLLVVTDGADTASNDRDTLEKLVDKAHKDEVLIYAIGLLNEEEPHEAKKAKRVLNALTTASGGLAFYPKQDSEVDELALEVAHDIRNQYIIAYTPTEPPDGSFRQIKVTVNGPGHPTVRTRTGYYATPETRTASLEKP